MDNDLKKFLTLKFLNWSWMYEYEDGKWVPKDWQNGASEIINVAVGKYRGSLLTGEQAVVGFIYKNGNYREYFGDKEEVFMEAVAKIKEKRN